MWSFKYAMESTVVIAKSIDCKIRKVEIRDEFVSAATV